MSALQWALLVLGAAAVVGIYISSRSSNRLPKDWAPPGAKVARGGIKLPGQEQADLFDGKGDFDEFGVGRPRKRTEPELGFTLGQPEAPAQPSAARSEPRLDTPKRAVEEKILTLLIAEREGAPIPGAKLHAALAALGLEFGERKIYHRLHQGQVVFSVASLIKPGTLDPAEQLEFSTRALTVFALLPGSVAPRAVLQDMADTTRALASALNAEVFDASKQLFNADAQRVLAAEVEAWAKRNGLQ